jgi:hypothetical protein
MVILHAAPCMMTCAKLEHLKNPTVNFCDYGSSTWSFLACFQEVAQALSSHLDSAEVMQQQACIRPLSPDGSPIIGQHPFVAGAYIATGVTCMVHSIWCMFCSAVCNSYFVLTAACHSPVLAWL